MVLAALVVDGGAGSARPARPRSCWFTGWLRRLHVTCLAGKERGNDRAAAPWSNDAVVMAPGACSSTTTGSLLAWLASTTDLVAAS